MEGSKSLNAIKTAILFERKGYAFYKRASELSNNSALKEFFMEMANEEKEHEDFLSRIFKHPNDNGSFEAYDVKNYKHKPAVEIINMELISKVSAIDYEAAAISAAIELERKSIEHYSKCAKESLNQDETRFYEFLAAWESTHLEQLDKLNQELTNKVWNDNSFWPF
jgi:rubrerythrin